MPGHRGSGQVSLDDGRRGSTAEAATCRWHNMCTRGGALFRSSCAPSGARHANATGWWSARGRYVCSACWWLAKEGCKSTDGRGQYRAWSQCHSTRAPPSTDLRFFSHFSHRAPRTGAPTAPPVPRPNSGQNRAYDSLSVHSHRSSSYPPNGREFQYYRSSFRFWVSVHPPTKDLRRICTSPWSKSLVRSS